MNFKSVLSSAIIRGAAALLMAAGAISCNTIYDDQSECPRGVSLRFVYDYNMEYVNSFHKKVHCVNVYVFDENGKYVDNWMETGDVLKDENWRMQKEIGEGKYTLLAYGGLCCKDSSFKPLQLQSRANDQSEISGVVVSLLHRDWISDQSLHPLFYGIAELEVGKDDYVEKTIYLKKDTNNIRFALQQMNGEAITADEFDVTIVDDNTVLDWQNEPMPAGLVTYKPWAKGETVIGSGEDGEPLSLQPTMSFPPQGSPPAHHQGSLFTTRRRARTSSTSLSTPTCSSSRASSTPICRPRSSSTGKASGHSSSSSTATTGGTTPESS